MAFGNTDHLPLFWVSTESASLEMDSLIPTLTLLSIVVIQKCIPRIPTFSGPETIFSLQSLLNKSLQIEEMYLL